MREMKYVVYEDGTFAVFSELIDHDKMNVKPVLSAGFVRFIATDEDDNSIICSKKIEVDCYGKSGTLKKVSRGDKDAQIIRKSIKDALG